MKRQIKPLLFVAYESKTPQALLYIGWCQLVSDRARYKNTSGVSYRLVRAIENSLDAQLYTSNRLTAFLYHRIESEYRLFPRLMLRR